MNRIGYRTSARLLSQCSHKLTRNRTLNSRVQGAFHNHRMVAEDGCNLKLIQKEKIDKILAWSAVNNDGFALEHVPERIKDDDIEYAAISQNGLAFQFVRKKSRDNEKLLIKAISQSKLGNPFYNTAEAVQFASKRLRNNLNVMKIAINLNPLTYRFAGKSIRDHKGLAIKTVQSSPCVVQYLSRRLRGDKEISFLAVREKGFTLKWLSKSMKNNRKIVEEAGKNECEALQFAGKELQNDPEIYRSSILAHRRYLPSPDKSEFSQRAHYLINYVLKYAGKSLQKNVGFRNEAFQKLGNL
jgi:hypothetical protein